MCTFWEQRASDFRRFFAVFFESDTTSEAPIKPQRPLCYWVHRNIQIWGSEVACRTSEPQVYPDTYNLKLLFVASVIRRLCQMKWYVVKINWIIIQIFVRVWSVWVPWRFIDISCLVDIFHMPRHISSCSKGFVALRTGKFFMYLLMLGPIISSVPDTSAPHFGIHRPKM